MENVQCRCFSPHRRHLSLQRAVAEQTLDDVLLKLKTIYVSTIWNWLYLWAKKKQASEHDTERDRASEKEIEMIKSPLCIELIEKNREWREWANEIERTTSCRLNYDDAQLRFFIIHSINSGPDVVHTHTAHTNEM